MNDLFKDLTNGELILELRRRGMLTRFRGHDAMLQTPEELKVILTRGVPSTPKECSRCGELKERENYHHYQSRVNAGDGYLRSTNAVCIPCQKKHKKELKTACANAVVPPRPNKGSVCPHCERSWPGQWHRHHQGELFLAWLCGNCNMSFNDHRNKDIENRDEWRSYTK